MFNTKMLVAEIQLITMKFSREFLLNTANTEMGTANTQLY